MFLLKLLADAPETIFHISNSVMQNHIWKKNPLETL